MGNKRQVTVGEGTRQPPVYDSYGRLSKVPETGELEKIDVQHADNRKVIERRGGVLGIELSDGLSAWNSRVRRPGWERLLERVESGESDGIVVWHTDRLFRQPRDLETLIELGERGFRVASAHGERDLADPDDRFILRIEVVHAARSSDDTSRRIKRRFETQRAKGIPHHRGRTFGFPGIETVPSGTGGERLPVSVELVAREVQALRDGAEALLSGGSLGGLVRQWNTAGLLTPMGNEWILNSLRETFKRATLAGRVEHDGELVGRMDGTPILDEKTFLRLRALFAGRKRGRAPGQRYVGSGILRCGVCFKPMSGRSGQGTYSDGSRRAQYMCNKQNRGCGAVYVDGAAADAHLQAFTITRWSDPEFAAAVSAAHSEVSERLKQVNTEINAIKGLQAALMQRVGKRQITMLEFDIANEPLANDLAPLLAERDSLSGGNPESPVTVMTAEAVAVKWANSTVIDRRAMVRTALEGRRLVVYPGTGGGRKVFDRNRIRPINPQIGTTPES